MKLKIFSLVMISVWVFSGCTPATSITGIRINIKQGSKDIPNLTGSFDFGKIEVNSSSSAIIFTIESLGTEDVNLTGTPIVEISGANASEFAADLGLTKTPIEAKSSTTFTITFNPTSVGSKTATVSIQNNDVKNSPWTFEIKGEGSTLTYCWTKIFSGDGWNEGLSITTDKSGNVYSTGRFTKTIDFGADFGKTDVKSSFGFDEDIYLIKINANGNYGWTKQIGGNSFDIGHCVKTDTAGNIYLTGEFADVTDFSADFTGSDSRTSKGDYDIFLTKINANGTYGWTKVYGGTDWDFGISVAVDGSGNIYITGLFYSTIDFGADFQTVDSKTPAGFGYEDIFVTKINSNRTYGWTKTMGSTYSDDAYSITADSSNNIYLTGEFSESVNFAKDFGGTDVKTSSGSYDIFVTKTNPAGTYGWTKRIGGNGWDTGMAITTDASKNVYLTGEFCSTVDFGADFGSSDIKITGSTSDDLFVTKINADGTYGWTKIIKGANGRDCAIATDSSGNIYVTGGFYGTVNFGEDFGVSDSKTSIAGVEDIFITKIKSNGTYGWTKRMGAGYADYGRGIAVDGLNNIYITGSFYGTVDFGADFGVSDSKVSGSSHNIFITKLSQ